jgi:hypothetical protein
LNPQGHLESPISLSKFSTQKELELNDDDIAIFRRVVQQIIRSDNPTSDLSDNTPDSPTLAQRGSSGSISSNGDVEIREVEDLDYHPKVVEYLSKLKDRAILSGHLNNMIEEKAALEEEREARLGVGLALDRDDQHRLDEVDTQLDELAEKIQLLEKELEGQKEVCLRLGLVDEVGKPTNIGTREHRYFGYDVDSEDEISDFIRYPVLLPRPGMNPRRNYEPKHDEQSDSTTMRINQWMLNQLRSSPLEVNLLARTFEDFAGDTIEDDWQTAVLKLWHKDGAGLVEGPTAHPAP